MKLNANNWKEQSGRVSKSGKKMPTLESKLARRFPNSVDLNVQHKQLFTAKKDVRREALRYDSLKQGK